VLDEQNLLFNQFQDDHLSRVAHAGAEFQNTSVTTIAVRKARGDLLEEALDHLVISKFGGHQTAGMHFLCIIRFCAVARNRDKAFGLPTDRVRLGARGVDSLVDKKLFDKVATECITGTARPS
jgi:hypothetical protein